MKKLLFQNFLKDTTIFFVIITLSIGSIVWVVQAVGFLDFITEDGHGLSVYFSYTLLNFPKIINRILPFVFFIALFYQLSQYELKNELLIFWTNGVNKVEFTNVILTYSLIITLLQIFLSGYVSPAGQYKARTFLKYSNIDYFPALIKEKKFIDIVSNLTFFIDSKNDNGDYINIFLKDNISQNKDSKGLKSQVIYAKKGRLVNEGQKRFFRLFDGEIINQDSNKITNITFEKFDFDLGQYETKTTIFPKIQEVKSYLLYRCIKYTLADRMSEFVDKDLICKIQSIHKIQQEFLKRFYKPIYFPLLALICCFIFVKSKENRDYNKYKTFLFLLIFLIIVISEISLRYSTTSSFGFLFFILFPIIIFSIFYTLLIKRFNNKS